MRKSPQMQVEQECVDTIAESLKTIADAISQHRNRAGYYDATGTHIQSLTDAITGHTAGLMAIAESINRLAQAHANLVRAHDQRNDTRPVHYGNAHE